MAQLIPYLRFDNNKCKEAMMFYKDILGGELTMQSIGETPMASEVPPDSQDKIMHASLMSPGIEFFGSDAMRDKVIIGDNVGLSLVTHSEEETRRLFSKLSEGGEIFMQLEKTFWAPLFGMMTDKYGIEWMINYEEKLK